MGSSIRDLTVNCLRGRTAYQFYFHLSELRFEKARKEPCGEIKGAPNSVNMLRFLRSRTKVQTVSVIHQLNVSNAFGRSVPYANVGVGSRSIARVQRVTAQLAGSV